MRIQCLHKGFRIQFTEEPNPVHRSKAAEVNLSPRSKSMKRILLILLPLGVALGQDAAGARDSVLALRKYVQEHQDTRGGVPQLTTIKHQLRDWIENQLASFPQDGNTAPLNAKLHAALAKDKLFCDDEADCFPTSL